MRRAQSESAWHAPRAVRVRLPVALTLSNRIREREGRPDAPQEHDNPIITLIEIIDSSLEAQRLVVAVVPKPQARETMSDTQKNKQLKG
jgi:hypothetical protein